MNTFEEGEIKEALPKEADGTDITWHDTFTWKCKETFVAKIAKAKHSQAFESKIFEIGGAQWFLRVYPNGSGKNNMGFVNLFLYLCTMPENVSKLRVKYSIACEETNTLWNHMKDFKHNAMGSGWSNHRLSRDKLFKFASFTFKASVAIFEKYDATGKLLSIPEHDSMHDAPPASALSSSSVPVVAAAVSSKFGSVVHRNDISGANGGGGGGGINTLGSARQYKKHSLTHSRSHHSISRHASSSMSLPPSSSSSYHHQAQNAEIKQIHSTVQSLANQLQEMQIAVNHLKTKMEHDAALQQEQNSAILQMLQCIQQEMQLQRVNREHGENDNGTEFENGNENEFKPQNGKLKKDEEDDDDAEEEYKNGHANGHGNGHFNGSCARVLHDDKVAENAAGDHDADGDSNDDDDVLSVQHWLNKIGYAQYYTAFTNRGYVDLSLVQQLTKDEFDTLEITYSTDQSKIWIAIQSLKSLHIEH